MKRLLLTLALLPGLTARAEFDPTQVLFDAFGADCSTSSDLTRKAQNQAQLLTNIAKGFRDDPACKVLAPGLDSLAGSLSQQNALYATNAAQNELNKDLLIKLQIGLAAELARAVPDQNPEFISQARSEIANLQIQIAQAESSSKLTTTQTQLFAADNARLAANSLAQSLAKNRACMVAHPSVFGQVLGAVMRVASGFFPGLIGAGISSAASIVDTLVTASFDKKMNGFVIGMRSEALNQAVGCTMEGLATTYCQGRDVEAIIKHFKEQQNDGLTCSEGVIGARIAGQELNALMDFIQSTSLTEGRATDKLTAKTLTSDRDVLETGLLAKIESAKLAIQKGDNVASVMDGLLEDLVVAIAAGSGRVPSGVSNASYFPANPESYSSAYGGNINFIKFNSSVMFVNAKNCGIWRYVYSGGRKGSQTDGDSTGDFNSSGNANQSKDSCLAAFKAAGFPPPTMEDFEAAVASYSTHLDSFVVSKLNTIQGTDPNSVLASADKRLGKHMSAIEVLAGIEGYLRATKADLNPKIISDRYLDASINNVLDKVVKAQQVYADDSVTDPQKKALGIYDIFGRENFNLFPVQFSAVVKNDMERRRGQNQDEYTRMLFAIAGTEAATVMQKFVGFTEHDTAGSIAARNSARNSLTQFAKLFSGSLNGNLVELSTRRDDVGRQMLGLSCMRTLLVPNPEESIPEMTRVCSGTEYKGDTLKPLKFNDYASKPFTQRVCSIYDYFRKAELASRITNMGGGKGNRAFDAPPAPYIPKPKPPGSGGASGKGN